MKSHPFQLFRSISEAPPSQWTNNHYVNFLKHRDVNLLPLVDLIKSKSVEGSKFFTFSKKEIKDDELFKKYEKWKNELLYYSEQNLPKLEISQMAFEFDENSPRELDEEDKSEFENLNDKTFDTPENDKVVTNEEDDIMVSKKIPLIEKTEEIDHFPYTISLLSFSKIDKILENLYPKQSTKKKNYEEEPRMSSQKPSIKNNQTLTFISEKSKTPYIIPKENSVKIGRDNKIPKNLDKDGSLSRHHCEVIYDEITGNYFLKDMNSVNGTYLKLSAGEKLELINDLIFECDGGVMVTVSNVWDWGVSLKISTDRTDPIDFNNKRLKRKWIGQSIEWIGEGKMVISTKHEEGLWKKLMPEEMILIEDNQRFKLGSKLVFKMELVDDF